jgi:ribonuclease HII
MKKTVDISGLLLYSRGGRSRTRLYCRAGRGRSSLFPCKVKGKWVKQVLDSKLLSRISGTTCSDFIRESSISFAVGTVSHDIIDKINILEATKLAMKQAIRQLEPQPDSLLIDFLKLPDVPFPQKASCTETVCAFPSPAPR